jgi:hypothetical protein
MHQGSCLCGSVKYSVVATLDKDTKLRPLANINVGSKCSWYSIADELPQFSSTPSAAEFGQLRASALQC